MGRSILSVAETTKCLFEDEEKPKLNKGRDREEKDKAGIK
jgi:hypothetical protein